ncbi:Uncharacterised protein [Collinsella intestinalis]|nr:Uncharacterised protein [Collinsella intestinalis]
MRLSLVGAQHLATGQVQVHPLTGSRLPGDGPCIICLLERVKRRAQARHALGKGGIRAQSRRRLAPNLDKGSLSHLDSRHRDIGFALDRAGGYRDEHFLSLLYLHFLQRRGGDCDHVLDARSRIGEGSFPLLEAFDCQRRRTVIVFVELDLGDGTVNAPKAGERSGDLHLDRPVQRD